MRRIAYRHVQFVCGNDVQLRIAILPPILVPDYGNIQRIRRMRRILDREDHACRRQKERHHNENGDHGPSQLHLCASVDLRGLAAVIALFVPEFHRRVGEQS